MAEPTQGRIHVRPLSHVFEITEDQVTPGGPLAPPPEKRHLARVEVFLDDDGNPDRVGLQRAGWHSQIQGPPPPTLYWSWKAFKRMLETLSLWANASILGFHSTIGKEEEAE